MQSTGLALSLSKPLLKAQNPINRNPNARFSQITLNSSPKSLNLTYPHGSSGFSCTRLSPWTSSSASSSSPFIVKAQSISESAGAGERSSGLTQTLELGAMFGTWYLFNIYFNIYNKQVLKVLPFPISITSFQFGIGTLITLFMWTFNIYKRPKITSSQLLAILPLAMVHTLGNLLTNVSLGKVSVSFTHTIKALEPFFSVVLSAMFLGEAPSLWVVSSLVPIVGGVALASLTEASFNWAGFLSAMASNVTNQSRNVFSKKFMAKKEASLDDLTIFSVITIMSFLMLLPTALFVEGLKFTPAYMQSVGVNVKEVCIWSLLAALCFHAYQQCSYMILGKVSPVTHSVGNCVKRVVVIITSVLFFRTSVSPINAIGTGVALTGVFIYSKVKRLKPKAA
eukprot:TRINITY_DN3603_c0_g3_i1.p1 TRINITY_DN3603_c0_g3~~TRINITY_DN3603_c0_g3_i1.p1  ORF type:complete len:396 (-),score=38.62 TRINITY_DN3603_c0_g3_i1:247-1434(-)